MAQRAADHSNNPVRFETSVACFEVAQELWLGSSLLEVSAHPHRMWQGLQKVTYNTAGCCARQHMQSHLQRHGSRQQRQQSALLKLIVQDGCVTVACGPHRKAAGTIPVKTTVRGVQRHPRVKSQRPC
jgi:hypothetical protein